MFRSLLAARPAFRSFSATSAAEAKLYVGNLSWGANEEALREQFGKFGQVTDCFIVRDTLSGRSKGFGFIQFEDDQSCDTAIAEMNEAVFLGRNLRVNLAMEREPRRQFPPANPDF